MTKKLKGELLWRGWVGAAEPESDRKVGVLHCILAAPLEPTERQYDTAQPNLLLVEAPDRCLVVAGAKHA